MLDTALTKDFLHTTPNHIKKLNQMGIFNVGDFLTYFPRTLENTAVQTQVSQINLETKNTLWGILYGFSVQKTRFGKKICKAHFGLEDGVLEVIWFRIPYNLKNFEGERKLFLVGKIKREYGKFQIQNPEVHFETGVHVGGLRTIYPESPPITSKWLREKISALLPFVQNCKNIIPEKIRRTENLLEKSDAIAKIHFPKTTQEWQKAQETLGFEEIFLIQCRVVQQKYFRQNQQKNIFKIPLDIEALKSDTKKIPFELTKAQKKTLLEIAHDLELETPMNRMVQGDVGAGKTVVALLVALSFIRKGDQVAFMAPTEILAKQHFQSFCQFLAPFEVLELPETDLSLFEVSDNVENKSLDHSPSIALLTGSVTEKNKKNIKENLKTGKIKIIIGTHALLTEDTIFKNLGLAVIDEQHRFGVKQRAILNQYHTHLLSMTATPIPRSLALTLYGDQDISVIDEKPKGRKPIVTRVVSDPSIRRKFEVFIEDQIAKGRQIFWVCPLVDESDNIEARNVKAEYENISQNIFPNRRVSFLHGKMKPKEKSEIMEAFKQQKFDILVSTSVIEVGVDIPNATVMVIENAERFGLAQLHQFRGRIGRNNQQSYCFLMVDKKELKQKERLKAMEQSNDGFYLSEVDFKLRGSGSLYGTKQSGIPDLKCANLGNTELIGKARNRALSLIEEDPHLEAYPLLKECLDGEKIYFS